MGSTGQEGASGYKVVGVATSGEIYACNGRRDLEKKSKEIWHSKVVQGQCNTRASQEGITPVNSLFATGDIQREQGKNWKRRQP